MRQVTSDRIYSVEEYIQHEWTAPVRSEFINGQLFEMPGEKDINNEIAGNLYVLLSLLLRHLGYSIYSHDIKVKIFEENKYYYPDLFITKEEKTDANRYIKSEPVLIVEVVSESSQVSDYVDKYIDYTKIPSLLYYIIVEPESSLITCYGKSEQSNWQTIKYTRQDDLISLEKLEVTFTLKEVYQ
jgi:Uma2 family endonuclease